MQLQHTAIIIIIHDFILFMLCNREEPIKKIVTWTAAIHTCINEA